MSLKSWSNTGEVVYGNDLNGNFNGLAAGTEIASGSITAAKTSAEAWSTFSPAATGFSGTPTTSIAKYMQRGKDVYILIDVSGTSNAATVTFTLPVAAKNGLRYVAVRTTDNGGTSVVGELDTVAASTTANVYPTPASGSWTSSGTKRFEAAFFYEAN
jgi:hypothetical protein